MSIEFERGSKDSPKGHAILYFKNAIDHNEIWATYLVNLPITVDLSKYVPPFLMNQVGELGSQELSSFAFPPAPELINNRSTLDQMAERRGDDVLFGGTVDPNDVHAAMVSVNDILQRYAQMCIDVTPAGEQLTEAQTESEGVAVNEVLYELMSDSDKLAELTKLVGRLRFAVETEEESLVREAEVDITVLANYLPDEYQIPRLLVSAKTGGRIASRLVDLCLQRCFHLTQQEFVKLGEVDKEIDSLEASGGIST